MQYDLLLRPTETPDHQTIARFFSKRAHYSLYGARVEYDNRDTGVHFSFTIDKDEITLHLEYIRPHIFALEAAREIEALASTFSCIVIDPADGTKAEPFAAARFLRDWLVKSKDAYQSDGITAEGVHLIMDKKTIEQVWRWNYTRAQVQSYYASLLEVAFAPRLHWAMDAHNRQTIRYVTWNPRIWVALPGLATHVLLDRKKFRLPDTLVPISHVETWNDMVWDDTPAGLALRSPIDDYGRWLWMAQFITAPHVPPQEAMFTVTQDRVHDAEFVFKRQSGALLRRA